jgi:hypothetical protein
VVSPTGDNITVTGVTVNPATATVAKGQTRTFSATVAGTGNPPQTVTWSVEGGGSGTSISSAGVLTVGAGEIASSLTVWATSAYDATKSGTANVVLYGITGFSFGGAPGVINGTDITISVAYSANAEIANLTPIITVTPNAAVYPPSGTPQNFTNPVTYILTSGDKFLTYTVTVLNSRARITSFSFADPPATGVIDEATKTITVTVPYTPIFSALQPTITVSPKATVSPASGTAIDSTNPVTYTVSAENGSTATYTLTVIVRGQGDVTLIYPEDPAAGAFPDTIILSKSGTGGNPTGQTLTVSGEYDAYLWRVDGSVKGNGKRITLSAAGYTTGTHQISVEVTRNGVGYSKSGSFRVES